MDGLKGLPWASCSSRSRPRANVVVWVVEYVTKNLRLSVCMSVFALCESRDMTHGFGSISMTLNGGLNALRLSVWPIPPWVVVDVGRGGAECEGACRGCLVPILAFAGAA